MTDPGYSCYYPRVGSQVSRTTTTSDGEPHDRLWSLTIVLLFILLVLGGGGSVDANPIPRPDKSPRPLVVDRSKNVLNGLLPFGQKNSRVRRFINDPEDINIPGYDPVNKEKYDRAQPTSCCDDAYSNLKAFVGFVVLNFAAILCGYYFTDKADPNGSWYNAFKYFANLVIPAPVTKAGDYVDEYGSTIRPVAVPYTGRMNIRSPLVHFLSKETLRVILVFIIFLLVASVFAYLKIKNDAKLEKKHKERKERRRKRKRERSTRSNSTSKTKTKRQKHQSRIRFRAPKWLSSYMG